MPETGPVERVTEFLRQWNRPGGHRGDLIYGVHTDPHTDRGADLTASDLQALLDLIAVKDG